MRLQEKQKKANNGLWYSGVCDDLYRKIAVWDYAYWTGGEVHSTRLWLDPLNGPVPKPTKMAHYLPLREIELEHLIRILESLSPNTPMLEEWQAIKKIWKHGKAVTGRYYNKSYWSRIPLPAGIHKVVTVVFYPEHLKELMSILQEAKTGSKMESKRPGKDLFEE